MSIKRFFSSLSLLALCFALMLTLASCDKCKSGHVDSDKDFICDVCGSDMPCDHMDADGDFLCDKCGEFYEAPTVTSDFKITVYTEDGGTLSSVKVSIFDDGKKVFDSVTGEDGTVSGNLAVGEYFVSFELTEESNIYIPASDFNITANGSNIFSYNAVDNTPDGSAEKPFFISEDEHTYTIPAGATYNFTLKGEKRTMVIENSNISVNFSGIDYTPDSGKVEISVYGPDDPSDPPTAFTVTNTSNTENEVTLRFVWKVGSRNNPITAELGTSYTTDIITSENTVYYILTATEDCTLELTSSTANGYISMMNLNTSAASNSTNGTAGSSITLSGVKLGDKVLIQVSVIGDGSSTVSFTITEM